MSDLIERQAAIDAIKKDMYADKDYMSALICEGIENVLNDLPSAQLEIIHCAECKYQDKGSNESNSWNLCEYRSWLYVPTSDEHYCGYAERRTDG